MHLFDLGSLALFLTFILAIDGLKPRDASGACASIAKAISGASEVYYAGLIIFPLGLWDGRIDVLFFQLLRIT